MIVDKPALTAFLKGVGAKPDGITYSLPFLCGEKKPIIETGQNSCQSKEEEKARLITLTEAGKRLGYSRTTIWRLVKAGTLPVVNPTGTGNNRVRLSDVIALSSGKLP